MKFWSYSFLWFLASFILVVAEFTNKTHLSQNDSDILQILPTLLGKPLEVTINETKYSVVISKQNATGTAVVTEKNKNLVHVLGRSNETSWIRSDTWVLVKYGNGDSYNSSENSCNGTRKTSILVNCDVNFHKPVLKYVGHNQQWKNKCFYMFEIVTNAICAPEEGMSGGSVFFILLLTAVLVYLIIGICYRRLIVGAKGFEQIPHYKFWARLGHLQSNCCRDREGDTWQRLTNNVKDPADDEDEALLRT